MKKTLIFIAAVLFSACYSYAQTNPYVGNPDISPAPIPVSNPNAVFSFDIGNTGQFPITYTAGDEIILKISLSDGVPQNTVSPLSSLGGTWLMYFDWSYSTVTNTYTGIQNQDIPATVSVFSPAQGTITINYTMTVQSTMAVPANGFNVNLTPNGASAGNTTNDDHTDIFTYTVTNPLPVTLVRFDGQASECNVTLSWGTAVEKDFDHFDVQYSSDGKNFATIGSVRSKNNPTGSTYSYTTAQAAGIGMYRLSMVDKDGSYSVSNIVTIHTQCSNNQTEWLVYPQPGSTGNEIYLQVDAAIADKIHATVTNMLGQKLLDRELEIQAGRNRFVLPATNWAAGTYLISITDGKQTTHGEKFVIR